MIMEYTHNSQLTFSDLQLIDIVSTNKNLKTVELDYWIRSDLSDRMDFPQERNSQFESLDKIKIVVNVVIWNERYARIYFDNLMIFLSRKCPNLNIVMNVTKYFDKIVAVLENK